MTKKHKRKPKAPPTTPTPTENTPHTNCESCKFGLTHPTEAETKLIEAYKQLYKITEETSQNTDHSDYYASYCLLIRLEDLCMEGLRIPPQLRKPRSTCFSIWLQTVGKISLLLQQRGYKSLLSTQQFLKDASENENMHVIGRISFGVVLGYVLFRRGDSLEAQLAHSRTKVLFDALSNEEHHELLFPMSDVMTSMWFLAKSGVTQLFAEKMKRALSEPEEEYGRLLLSVEYGISALSDSPTASKDHAFISEIVKSIQQAYERAFSLPPHLMTPNTLCFQTWFKVLMNLYSTVFANQLAIPLSENLCKFLKRQSKNENAHIVGRLGCASLLGRGLHIMRDTVGHTQVLSKALILYNSLTPEQLDQVLLSSPDPVFAAVGPGTTRKFLRYIGIQEQLQYIPEMQTFQLLMKDPNTHGLGVKIPGLDCSVCKKKRSFDVLMKQCVCKRKWYCSRDCQRSEWKTHKQQCSDGFSFRKWDAVQIIGHDDRNFHVAQIKDVMEGIDGRPDRIWVCKIPGVELVPDLKDLTVGGGGGGRSGGTKRVGNGGNEGAWMEVDASSLRLVHLYHLIKREEH
ncbi:UNVERIFIED_CONTAM: hypothetical protein HDU68_002953 [Siphonaria sp. JEL0065]|nr:hypothetical protein HDU68_002953 [Siphonaria sp. JEL0065]